MARTCDSHRFSASNPARPAILEGSSLPCDPYLPICLGSLGVECLRLQAHEIDEKFGENLLQIAPPREKVETVKQPLGDVTDAQRRLI